MGAVDLKSMEGSVRIQPANGRSSRSAHGVGRERKSEPRERESKRVGTGGWRGGARLQCGVRGWPGTSSTVGTWRRPTNLGLGVVETEPSQTVRRPKRTVREARCYKRHTPALMSVATVTHKTTRAEMTTGKYACLALLCGCIECIHRVQI